jgi:hypothetical protein
MTDTRSLDHGGSPLHDFLEHADVYSTLTSLGWVVIGVCCFVLVLILMEDWDENLVKHPNKRLEEWRAKQYRGEERDS